MAKPNVRDFFIILDKSTSMESCAEAAVNHFNQTVRDIKEGSEDFDGETYVSLVTFATKVYFKFWRQPLSQLREIRYNEFNPDGWTALHDAIGMTLAQFMEDVPGADHPILVSVITDGQENNSEKYENKIAPMITELQAKGNWTFTYLGANHDVVTAATSMGFAAGNTAMFTSTNSGVKSAASYSSSRMGSYMRNLNTGGSGVQCFYSATGDVADLREENDKDGTGGASQPWSVTVTPSIQTSHSIINADNLSSFAGGDVQISTTDAVLVADPPKTKKKKKKKNKYL